MVLQPLEAIQNLGKAYTRDEDLGVFGIDRILIVKERKQFPELNRLDNSICTKEKIIESCGREKESAQERRKGRNKTIHLNHRQDQNIFLPELKLGR